MKFKLLTLLICTTVFCNAQNFDRAKMNALFSNIENKSQGMGSVSIFKEGKEVYQKHYGFSDIESKTKANAHTKYRIGSISKTYTASIMMKLIEERQLSLQTKLSAFYPEIKNADRITIEHLLRHQSGIFNFTNEANYLQWNINKISKEEHLKKIAASQNVFEPGSKSEYSNSNYVLLTFIAEDVSGKAFTSLLEQYVIQTCGLEDTAWGSKISRKNNEAKSYKKRANWQLEIETDMSVPLGAGAIISTPTELNIFLNALFAAKIVTKESLGLMQTIEKGFGIGMFQVPFYDIKGYGHTGGIDGFQSNAFYFPDQQLSVSLTSNAVNYPMNDILIGILSIYFEKEYQLPEFTPSIILQSEELDKYLGIYSSAGFPLKITITKNNNTLIVQATGQASFAVENYAPDCFKFEQAKLKIEFHPAANRMTLLQGGGKFELSKE